MSWEIDHKDDIEALRDAFQKRNLTLFLGAGVSMASGLPSWKKLVAYLYVNVINQDGGVQGWNVYSNYLYAIAEWLIDNSGESLEITTRKIRASYHREEDFLKALRQALYPGFMDEYSKHISPPGRYDMLQKNPTLKAVTALCSASHQSTGVHAVVTYNFDDLLEWALDEWGNYKTVWKARNGGNRSAATPVETGKLPIYHVHGYVPMVTDRACDRRMGSYEQGEIIFSEEDYHRATHDAFHWANLVQGLGN